MNINIEIFIAMVIALGIIGLFIAEWLTQKNQLTKHEANTVSKLECEVCASFFFIADSFKYWRCPLCSSINLNKKNK